MEENNYQPEIPEEEHNLPEELSFSEKLTGMFTSPDATFSNMAYHTPKAGDWLFPILIYSFVISFSFMIVAFSPNLKDQSLGFITHVQELKMQDQLKEGNITASEMEMVLDQTRGFMDMVYEHAYLSPIFFSVLQLLLLLIIALVFFLLAKILGGQGNYSYALVAVGMPHYILCAQSLVTILYILIAQDVVQNLSIGSLMHLEPDSLSNTLLTSIGFFNIWFYAAISVGLARLFSSEDKGKYYIGVFGIWLVYLVVNYFIS